MPSRLKDSVFNWQKPQITADARSGTPGKPRKKGKINSFKVAKIKDNLLIKLAYFEK